MAELSVDWYWQTDAEHNIEQFGPVARDLLGERATEALGQPLWALHPDGASDAEWAAHRADLDAHRPFRGFEYAIRQRPRPALDRDRWPRRSLRVRGYPVWAVTSPRKRANAVLNATRL
jgi:PAS domain-containing protein